ncbi:MAG: hypothetical protein ACJ77M_20435 [Thermoleophilaceae bacterium]
MRTALIAGALALLVAGCGAGTTTRTVTEPGAPPAKPAKPKSQTKRVAPAHCPAGIAGCKSVRGLAVYVQAVDPDGDGDAHVAVVDRHSLTYPGIAVVKVTREMRPRRLPREGDEVSAAGAVQASSDGSPEIRAAVLHVSRR